MVKGGVLGATVSDDLTRRGKPANYSFLLECGHTRSEFHNPTSVGAVAMWSSGAVTTLGCRSCTAGQGLTYFDRLRLGRLPARALDNPEVAALWEKVKSISKSEVA